jgi:magnesium chelatase family protein
MFFKLDSFAIIGIHAIKVSVEVHISNGLPSFTIVGLPDKAINESRLRVRAAIINSDFKFPLKRIIINLSPADIKKEGAFYDLPVALAILYVSNQINTDKDFNFNECCFIGELSLNGEINSVRGIIPMAESALKINKKYFIVPFKNLSQAALIKNINIIGCKNLKEIIQLFSDKNKLIGHIHLNNNNEVRDKYNYDFDLSEIKGQLKAKRALEIAVSGMHNLMLIGPPGAGKTMLAQRLVTIMPELSFTESIEVTKIYSIYKKYNENLIYKRPFRNPHHTISRISFIGGGIIPKPGEISLSHRGVLFLDEFSQFPKNLVEDLRQPIENKKIVISRNNISCYFPCNFMLVIATNPCRCGFYGDGRKKCVCSIKEIKNFWNNISGPIIDRIDMKINVPRLRDDDLIKADVAENSENIRKRVEKCISLQSDRYKNYDINYNSEVNLKIINCWIKENNIINEIIPAVIKKYNLTTRGIVSLIKISRTIADMEKSNSIEKHHFLEAIQYRINNYFDSETFN